MGPRTMAGVNSIGMPCSMPVTGNGVYSDVNGHNGLQWNARLDENLRAGKDRIYGNIFRTSYVNDGKNVRPGFTTKGYNPAGDPSTSLYVAVNGLELSTGRRSTAASGQVNAPGPPHSRSCSGSVQARKT